jgi:LacI family transcriptional regulator
MEEELMAVPRATLNDVAREAGVSRATVSLVIRNSPLVADVTREKVEAAIEKLGYVRNLNAARLRLGHSRVIGVVVPHLVNPFFAEFLTGVETVANDAGFAVLLANSHDDPTLQLKIMTRMREHAVDGLLICPADGTRPGTLSPIDLAKMPVVQVLRRIRSDLDYVGPDYHSGVTAAVDHLVHQGHKVIAFATYSASHSAHSERLAGFEAALARHGLPPGPLLQLPWDVSELPGCVKELLEMSPAPTATLCFNDLVAFGLTAGFYDLGMTVGKDHALIGFDDLTNSELTRPRFTAVATYPTRIGRLAARRMLLRLVDKNHSVEAVITETALIIRQSCGSVPLPPRL